MLIHSLRRLCSGIFAALLLSIALSASPARAQQPYGPTDFIIADFSGGANNGRIAVYDQNLVFKGYLDTNFVAATGLDFLCNGNLVAAGQIPPESSNQSQVKQYSPSGAIVSSFSDSRLGFPLDIKTSPANLLYIGTQSATSVAEFTLSGTYNRTFGGNGYSGVAVLPGGVLWAGGPSIGPSVDVFNISSGALITSIPLDNGQSDAVIMFYSTATNTVLMTDTNGIVYERTTSGSFLRSFTPPVTALLLGVTRGPGGDVFATDVFNLAVYRWLADGTFVSATDISASNSEPEGIVWAGNIGAGCTADTFLVNYFAGANGARPDQTVRITNTGAQVTAGGVTADLCANIYVFRNDQQLTECCSCLVTPNGLRTLSVDFDLAHNPLTAAAIGEGVIKIVSSNVNSGPTPCPLSKAGTTYSSVSLLRAWGTHNQDVSGGLQGSAINQVTETHFLDATLSKAELSELQTNCGFINSQGSGHGICSCGRGD